MNISLENQRILVTGASRGIGCAIAEQLSASGAEVLIHYHKNQAAAKELQQQLPTTSHIVPCDLGDLEQVKGWIPRLVDKYGEIDAVINNAGIAVSVSDEAATDQWTATWLHTMTVNVNALAVITKEFVQHARLHKSGRVVNISSRAAFQGDTPDYLAYASSKSALVGFTRSVARYYGKEGIRAFIIAPGFVRTDMAQDFMDQYGEDFALHDIALERLTEPKDIAPMVCLLVSGLADHATGSTIDINAGSYVH
ncbi:3-oxoacyl-ACP reductase [Echinicola strongylocentroti]|uniref:3-oxoacyl-ACP reductase n=1 Tax=Echinicola strongylocentroti TaxID=1795355 RepID=A0A2Z4IK22_9BACT|nr:SDR family oxidoreductase [Echinicola strongylocentroti]AWW30733.1 3-oxoacyl-ACP reductase [Echinicola strongylocentroti]